MSGDSFLERDAELDVIRLRADGAATGRAGVVLVEGEAGSGKSALLGKALSTAAERGLRILVAQGSEFEQRLEFETVRQLFEPVIASADPSLRDQLFAGNAAVADPVFSAPDRYGAVVEGSVPVEMLNGLFWLTANLAGRSPLLLAIDDLHLCDTASLQWFGYLARRLEGLPVMLAATVSAGEQSPLITDLGRSPLCQTLRPKPLSRAAILALIGGSLPGPVDDEFTTACFEATEGNPFLLQEVLRALAALGATGSVDEAPLIAGLGPESIAEATLRRLRRRGPAAVEVAQLVATVSVPVTPDLVSALSSAKPATVLDAINALTQIGVLRRGADGVKFAHPVVRNAIYDDQASADRDARHRSTAAILSDSGAPVSEVAAHLLATDPAQDRTTVTLLIAAADEAMRHGTPSGAVRFLRRALAEPPEPVDRVAVLSALGRAELQTNGPAAVEPLRQAWLAQSETSNQLPAADAAIRLAHAWMIAGQPAKGIAALETAVRSFDPHSDPRYRLEAELLGMSLLTPDAVPRAVKRFDEVRRWLLPQPLTIDADATRGLLALIAAYNCWVGGEQVETTALAQRALAGGRLLQTAPVLYPYAVSALVATDELDVAIGHLEEAIDDAKRNGAVIAYALWAGLRAQAQLRRGDVAAAAADIRLAIGATADAPQPALALRFAVSAEILLETRDPARAQQALVEAGLSADLPGDLQSIGMLETRGLVRLANRDPNGALADFLELGRRCSTWGILNPAVSAWRAYAGLAQHQLGFHGQARELVTEHIELARVSTPRALGLGLRVAGLLSDGEAAVRNLAEAAEVLERSPARLELAKAVTALGAAHASCGRAVEARAALRRGLDLAQECGSATLAQHAYAELVAAGGRPRNLRLSGVGALSPTERQVARLVISGMTNRQVAQSLFVTQRAIELHLTSVYRKLRITGRSQLAEALGQSSPTEDITEGSGNK